MHSPSGGRNLSSFHPIILNFRSLVSFAEGFTFPIAKIYRVVVVWLYEETNDYDGLRGDASGPSKTTLKARVDRYALDIQNTLPGARAIIIQVDH